MQARSVVNNFSRLENDPQYFIVSKPVLKNGHVFYNVKGIDADGTWEGQRRYNEFFCLHESLVHRWPGIYIPKIPPKQAIV
jgi:hypothetical protein